MFELDHLRANLAGNTDLESSTVLLVNTIATELDEAKNDPARVQMLADQLHHESQQLAKALVANLTSNKYEPLPHETPGKPAPGKTATHDEPVHATSRRGHDEEPHGRHAAKSHKK